jgi:hypothetical protein
MAWTTPATFLAGQLVTEADLNVQIRDNENVLKTAIDDSGKLTALTSSYVANLDGSALTGIALLGASNSFTAGTHDFNGGAGTRVVLPVGSNKWAT